MTSRKKRHHHLIDNLHEADHLHEKVSRIAAKQHQLKQRIEALKQKRKDRPRPSQPPQT